MFCNTVCKIDMVYKVDVVLKMIKVCKSEMMWKVCKTDMVFKIVLVYKV